MQRKDQVDYSRGMKSSRCKNCVHFKKPDRCAKVYGVIDPEFWCRLFKLKR